MSVVTLSGTLGPSATLLYDVSENEPGDIERRVTLATTAAALSGGASGTLMVLFGGPASGTERASGTSGTPLPAGDSTTPEALPVVALTGSLNVIASRPDPRSKSGRIDASSRGRVESRRTVISTGPAASERTPDASANAPGSAPTCVAPPRTAASV